jgi:hypothetical protein
MDGLRLMSHLTAEKPEVGHRLTWKHGKRGYRRENWPDSEEFRPQGDFLMVNRPICFF